MEPLQNRAYNDDFNFGLSNVWVYLPVFYPPTILGGFTRQSLWRVVVDLAPSFYSMS
jgi:hypothetical protein